MAKSTHAGIPWLLFIRQRLGPRVHFWPFDGWGIPAGRSAIAEVYPALWSRDFASEGRTYTAPILVLYRGATHADCGGVAQSGVGERPFVRGDLTVGMHVPLAQHQNELLFGEVRIDQ